jgi:hypothetical protein
MNYPGISLINTNYTNWIKSFLKEIRVNSWSIRVIRGPVFFESLRFNTLYIDSLKSFFDTKIDPACIFAQT